MMETNAEQERLAGRVALLNAENERLKKIIQKYEKRIAEDLCQQTLTNEEEINEEIQRLTDLNRERLAEVEHWKRECSEMTSQLQRGLNREQLTREVKLEMQDIVQKFKNEIELLKREGKELNKENEKLRMTIESLQKSRETSSRGSNEQEKTTKEYNRLIRNLKIELEEYKESLEKLKKEKSEMVTKEFHFEKLKEQEVNLLSSLSMSSHGNMLGHSPGTIIQLQADLTALTVENQKLANALKEINEREKERRDNLENMVGEYLEHEAKLRMQNLEEKINQLIDENEEILRENEQLKEYSISRRSGHPKDTRKNDQKASTSSHLPDGQLTSRMKDLEAQLYNKESEVTEQREIFEARIERLEKELIESRKNIGSFKHSQPHKNIRGVENMKSSLEEAYGIISKLEKENNTLISKIDHIEVKNVRRKQENNKYYDLIASQDKLVKDRGFPLQTIRNDELHNQRSSNISKRDDIKG